MMRNVKKQSGNAQKQPRNENDTKQYEVELFENCLEQYIFY